MDEAAKQRRRERHRAYQKAYVARNRDEVNKRRRLNGRLRTNDKEYFRRYREEHREQCLERNRRYKLANREKIQAAAKLYSATHLVQIAATARARYRRMVSVAKANDSPEVLMRAVNAAIPPALPRFIKDEIAGEMMLAVLEGALLLNQIRSKVQEYLRGYNRQYDTFKFLSLDAPVTGTEDLRRIDMLTEEDSVFRLVT